MKIFWPVFAAILAAFAVIAFVTRKNFTFWRFVDLIIGGVFIYAGVLKVIDPIQFGLDIDNYKSLPWFVSVRLAFYLPWLEILCGVAVIFRFLYRGGLSILSALITVFIGATIAAKVRGLDITCGCFGHASQHWSFPQHMAVDLLLFAALIAALVREYLGLNLLFRFFGEIYRDQQK